MFRDDQKDLKAPMSSPAFGDLSPIVPLRNQVYPPVTFGDSLKIKAFLDYVGTLFLMVLERVTLTATAPRTRSHIVDVLHSDFDGWDVLENLAKKTLPSLGRLDLDITSMIIELRVLHGMLLQTYLTSAKRLAQTITLAGVATVSNQLQPQFLCQLLRCTNMIPILSTKNHSMRTFLRMYEFSTKYMAELVSFISQYLTDGGA